MKKNKKHMIQVALFGILLCTMFLICIRKPSDEISLSERRPLQQFPSFRMETVKDGSFMKKFDQYSVDQFPFRETFRRLHAVTVKKIFRQTDMEGLYYEDNHLIAKEYPLHVNSLQHATTVFQNIYQNYLKDISGNIYLSIIPDKSYFLQKDRSYLTMDYDKLIQTMVDTNPQFHYIEIASLLQLEDYYTTDPHWKQESLLPVAEKLSKEMGHTPDTNFIEHSSKEPYFGTYAGQYAASIAADHIHYLTNDTLKNLRVYDHQNKKEIPLYDFERLTKRDPYEFFLSGPLSYITIENPNADSSKELIVFRDSFASPLAPLLVSGYQKITLLDIRYLPSRSLKNHINFQDQDVLFLYSTSVLNHSETLK